MHYESLRVVINVTMAFITAVSLFISQIAVHTKVLCWSVLLGQLFPLLALALSISLAKQNEGWRCVWSEDT